MAIIFYSNLKLCDAETTLFEELGLKDDTVLFIDTKLMMNDENF